MARGKGNESTTRIILFGGYEILRDTMNYTVVYNTGKVGKDGDITYKYLAYHGTLEQALKSAKKEYVKREIRKRDILSLDEAIAIVVRANNRFESLVKNAFEGATS